MEGYSSPEWEVYDDGPLEAHVRRCSRLAECQPCSARMRALSLGESERKELSIQMNKQDLFTDGAD